MTSVGVADELIHGQYLFLQYVSNNLLYRFRTESEQKWVLPHTNLDDVFD